MNNPNLTDEQLDKIATKIAEKGFYTKSEVDSMIAGIVVPTRLSELADDAEHRTVTDTEKEKWNKPSITVDTELNENSNNPIANKVVTTRLKGMYEGLADKADRTELENYATKTELDTKADKFTIDNEVKADSNNPVSSKAVDGSLNELNNIFRETLQEMGQGFMEQLGTKANTTDIPTKLAQLEDDTTHRLVTDEEKAKWNSGTGSSVTVDTALSDTSENPVQNKAIKTALDSKVDKSSVITKLENEDFDNENPISAKAFYGVVLGIVNGFEQKELSHHADFELVGLDKNTLYVITKAWNDELGYTELWFVFYGRENNKNDTLADGDGDDSISVNGVKVLERPLAYIRKRGTYFYTCGHFKLVGNFIFWNSCKV